MRMKEYRGEKKHEISFPLGGIGTGCIGLGGDGRFREWEIFNRPAKGKINGFSHLAIRAERDGKVVDARAMHTDLRPPFTGEIVEQGHIGFGHGPYRETMNGIPHFEDGIFRAAYPLSELEFIDRRFPGHVTLSAFNPFIPLREDDSSLPAAFFEITVANTTETTMNYTIALSLSCPYDRREASHTLKRDEHITCLQMIHDGCDEQDVDYGQLCVATDASQTSFQRYWYRGRWYDNMSVFWHDFTQPGSLKDRVYEGETPNSYANMRDTGTLAAHISVPAGEERQIRFVVSWYIPNCVYYLDLNRVDQNGNKQWKNYYATRYENAYAVAADALKRWDILARDTRAFAEAFYSQTLPEPILDAAGANISILKSPTVLRLEDGSFYGWEGVHCRQGSCEGSCTHVWNYAYAMPFLFPKLERSMRELNYRYNQDEHGGMHFRLHLPLGAPQDTFRPCCDGQFGDVIKVYREWKLCGDTEWLRMLWPKVKKSIEYAWSDNNCDRWDMNRDGVLEGRQHHTLDMELFGPNSWLTSMYLAALKAASEMAEALDEPETACDYRALYQKGAKTVDRDLFNGEYYFQQIDLEDQSILEPYDDGTLSLNNDRIMDAYWNAEGGELKYQYGEGCEIDQVLGQWHATLCGLGDVLSPNQVKRALEAMMRYNFKRDMRLHFNPCRLYTMADEQGAVICEWPQGRRKPIIPAPYAEECWTGLEYELASHLILHDMLPEALEVVTAVRARFDGHRRNPWNEFECGSNYARAMSSYALILASSGFRFDLTCGKIGFVPHDALEERRYLWSVEGAWGVFGQNGDERTISLKAGELRLETLETDRGAVKAVLNGQTIDCISKHNTVLFPEGISLKAGDELTVC